MKAKTAGLLAIVGSWITISAVAALPPDAEQDVARWQAVTLFAHRFDPPPDGWHRCE